MTSFRNLFLLPVLFFATCSAAAQDAGWERMDNPSTFDVWDMVFTDSLNGHAVSDYGAILRSTDGGASWTQKLAGEQAAMRGVHFFDSSTGIACGYRGSLLRTTDAGASWTVMDAGVSESIPALSAVGSTAWIGGKDGVLLKSTDAGLSWQRLSPPTEKLLSSIMFTDQNHGWCASPEGVLMRSDDAGEDWDEVGPPTAMPITAILASAYDTCLAACYDGEVYQTFDGGEHWTNIKSYRTQYGRLIRCPDGAVWAAGRRGVIARMDPGTAELKLQFLTGEKTANGVCAAPGGAMFAFGSGGVIFRLLPAREVGNALTPTDERARE